MLDFEKKIQSRTLDPSVSIDLVVSVLEEHDPKKPKLQRDAFVARGFGKKYQDIPPKTMIQVTDFMQQLGQGVVDYGNLEDESL